MNDQYSISKSIVLHLLPGAIGTFAYALLAPLFLRNGYPAILALLVAAGFVIMPIELVYLLIQAKKMALLKRSLIIVKRYHAGNMSPYRWAWSFGDSLLQAHCPYWILSLQNRYSTGCQIGSSSLTRNNSKRFRVKHC